MLTIEDISRVMPGHLKANVSQGLVDMVNGISADPEYCRTIRDNFVSYASVLKEGRFRTEDYVHAVAYVSYKLMGFSNQDAYARTFPQRYTQLLARGCTAKEISSYVAAYNKNKLVNLILEQTLIPVWVLNQDVYQKAIATQLELMTTAKSEKVRAEAANSILTHLKKPEKREVELSIDTKDSSGLNELKDKLRELAEIQQGLIQQGLSTREIAHQKIIEGEVVEAEVVPEGTDPA